MSNTNDDNARDASNIRNAAEQVDGQQVEQNLEGDKNANAPEQLSEEEQTSFIQDDLRTDK